MNEENSAHPAAPEAVLTASQQQAFDQLTHFAVVHTLGLHKVSGISVRPYPLVISPSGCGKTFLVEELARRTAQPFFTINLHNWIVRGAKNDTQITLDQLADFVRTNSTGVVLIDEVNKLTSQHAGESTWSASVLSEIIALMDMGERLDCMGFGGLCDKLRSHFFFVGAAAFQDEWNASNVPSIGFANGEEPAAGMTAFEKAVRAQKVVPDELLYRFNDQLVVLAPPTREEFERRIASIREELELPPLGHDEIRALAVKAAQSGKMMRWLEGYAALCTRDACPKRMYALGLGGGLGSQDSKAADAEAEKARERDYQSAYSIYGMRLEKLAESALAAASLIKELTWLSHSTSGDPSWGTIKKLLQAAELRTRTITGGTPETLAGALRALADSARRVCHVSTRDGDEHTKLTALVFGLSEGLEPLVWGLIGQINRSLVGAPAMETLHSFVGSAACLVAEHRNLEAIQKADYKNLSRRGEGDMRRLWLLPAGNKT